MSLSLEETSYAKKIFVDYLDQRIYITSLNNPGLIGNEFLAHLRKITESQNLKSVTIASTFMRRIYY
jgi:hypothetical protein